MKVDLPQPDGPMMAVTRFAATVDADVLQGPDLAVVEIQVPGFDLRMHVPSLIVAVSFSAGSG